MPVFNLPAFRKSLEWIEAGRAVAIATVVDTWASAPSPTGSRLIVGEGGDFTGSVSGGFVEAEVIGAGLEVIETRVPRLLEFGVADDAAWHAGLSCGGHLKVYVEAIGAAQAHHIRVLAEECAARRACVLVTDVDCGEQRLVRADEVAGDPLADLLVPRLLQGRSVLLQHGGRRLFFDVQMPSVRLLLVGATQIAQTLAAAARLVGFEVTVADPRPSFATENRFPETPLVTEWPEAVPPELGLDRFSAVALLAHDPQIDDPALCAALRAKCFYVGALGSKANHRKRLERMRLAGFSDAEVAQIHAPIGLAIGAANGAEIAIAILAEIIAALRCAHREQEIRADAAVATPLAVSIHNIKET